MWLVAVAAIAHIYIVTVWCSSVDFIAKSSHSGNDNNNNNNRYDNYGVVRFSYLGVLDARGVHGLMCVCVIYCSIVNCVIVAVQTFNW